VVKQRIMKNAILRQWVTGSRSLRRSNVRIFKGSISPRRMLAGLHNPNCSEWTTWFEISWVKKVSNN